MNRMFRIAVQLCAAACLAPSIAQAAIPLSVYQGMVVPIPTKHANQGFYYSGHFGQISPDRIKLDAYDKEASYLTPTTPAEGETQTVVPLPNEVDRPYGPSILLKNSYMLGGTIGYRTGNVRMELELSYHRNNVRKVRGLPSSAVTITRYDANGNVIDPFDLVTPVRYSTYPNGYGNLNKDKVGRLTSVFLMANLIYDFYLGNGIFPFVGIGLGGAYTEINAPILKGEIVYNNDNGEVVDALTNAERLSFDSTGFDYALQAILGVGYVFSDHVEADLVYKYFETRLNDFGIDNFEASNVTTSTYTPSKVRFEPKSYGGSFFALEIRIH